MRIQEMDPWRSLTKLFCSVFIIVNYIKDYIWFAVNLVSCRNLGTSTQEIYVYPKTLQKGDNTYIES